MRATQKADSAYLSSIARAARRGELNLKKTPRISFITIFLMIFTLFTFFSAKSEAAYYSTIVVTSSGFSVNGGTTQPLSSLNSYVGDPANSIGILSFGDAIVYPITVYADITGSLSVGSGTAITLASDAGTSGADVTVSGTITGNVAAGTGFVKVNSGGTISGNVTTTTGFVSVDSGGAINGKIGDAAMSGNVTIASSGIVNSSAGTPTITTTGAVNIYGGDVSNRKIYDASSVSLTSGTDLLSTGQYAIDSTRGNVKVEESNVTALMSAITGTGGNVTVTDSDLTVGIWPAPIWALSSIRQAT